MLVALAVSTLSVLPAEDGDPFFVVDNPPNEFIRSSVADVSSDVLVASLEDSFWGDMCPSDEPLHVFATRINSQEVVKVRESDGAIVERIAVDQQLRSIGYDPVSDTLFALNQSGTTVDLYSVDRASGTTLFIGATGIPGGPLQSFTLCWDPVTGTLVTATGSGTLYAVDPATGVASELSDVGFGDVFSIGYSQRDRGLYLIPAGASSLYRLDRTTGAVDLIGGPLSLPTTPTGMAFSNEFCQQDLGFEGRPGASLSVCGEDLAQSGASAVLRVRGAEPGAIVWLVGGADADPRSLFGETLVPSEPVLEFRAMTTDASGAGSLDLAPIAGLGVDFVLQAAVFGDRVDLTNALSVDL